MELRFFENAGKPNEFHLLTVESDWIPREGDYVDLGNDTNMADEYHVLEVHAQCLVNHDKGDFIDIYCEPVYWPSFERQVDEQIKEMEIWQEDED